MEKIENELTAKFVKEIFGKFYPELSTGVVDPAHLSREKIWDMAAV